MTRKKKLLVGSTITGIIVGAAIGSTVYWLAWEGDAKPIVAVADEFKAPPDWKIKTNHVEPPRHACIDIECPSVTRSWKSSRPVETDELSRIVANTRWNSSIKGDCNLSNSAAQNKYSLCSTKGVVDGYNVKVIVTRDLEDPSVTAISLHLREYSQHE